MMVNDTLDVLSNENRRNMMYSISEMDEDEFTYDDLIDRMIDEGYLREDERQSFKDQLTHQHLPKMEQSEFMEYDADAQVIEPLLDQDVEEFLEFLEQLE